MSPEDAGRLDLYRQMLRIRRFDDNALQCFADGRIYGTMHPYTGQEAIAVGVCSLLEPGDRVGSNHRGHGHTLAAGADPKRMMAELFGREDGYCRGKGGSMHVADISRGMFGANGVVGAGVPIAVGVALAAQLDGDRVVACFFSDGATGQGIVWESLNFAALWKLPILFVCENNLWGVNTPVAEALAGDGIAAAAAAHGLGAQVLDGNDVDAVRAAATGALRSARAGAGPTLLECRTERMGIHSTNTPEGRDEAAIAKAQAADPLPRLRARLLEAGATEADLKRVRDEVDREIEAAIEFAEASPFPAPETALEGVFA